MFTGLVTGRNPYKGNLDTGTEREDGYMKTVTETGGTRLQAKMSGSASKRKKLEETRKNPPLETSERAQP